MAFCPNCGSSVEGRFCAKCGASVAPTATASTAAPGTGYSGAAGSGYSAQTTGYTGAGAAPGAAPQAAGLSENAAGALCYLLGLITGVVFLVLAPYNQNRNIKFHAFQSIFLNIAWIALWIVFSIISFAFSSIVPIIGGIISLLVWLVIGLGMFVLWLVMMFKTYSGSRIVLPVIGPLAEKQANS